ncbi:heterokaryon incompatibility protein-domain-containing protein [Xylaria venustula]|nr:heterokaryon incompatibility protein-domain-containing protein [Xylaria venustula]
MRLIDTASLELKEFLGEPANFEFPRYAILSHTWGEEEVTLQDMQNLEVARKKAGFDKIVKCCETARNEGLGWAWIDTCCIDKTSSAELSEAINSMFKWYGTSTICYAYLSDVGVSSDGLVSSHSTWKESRWFTRGWTLQELIAPFEVILYDRNWKQLCTKRQLANELEERTGIPKNVLLNSSLIRENTVASRMSWAEHRRTTRIEDRAYSLLGLFDINMPLLYGEGKKAFARLHREILETIDDDTIFLGGIEPTTLVENDFLVTPGNILVTHRMDSIEPYYPTNIPGNWRQDAIRRDLRLRGDVLSMNMSIIEITIRGQSSKRTGITMKKQFQDEMVSEDHPAVKPSTRLNPKYEGRSLCLGILRCGRRGQFVARYFMCSLINDGISAYPTPWHRFVLPEVASRWPYMPCNIQLNRGVPNQPRVVLPLRTPFSWSSREISFPIVFDNGWILNSIFPDADPGHVSVYLLSFKRRDEIWKLTFILNRHITVPGRIILTCDTDPGLEAQIVNIGNHEREGVVAELCRRMPVLGGSAELVISVYHEIDPRKYFTPMIRFRAFEPSEDEKVE